MKKLKFQKSLYRVKKNVSKYGVMVFKATKQNQQKQPKKLNWK